MIATRLHASAWDCPNAAVEIKFTPPRLQDFACAGRCQDQKTESKLGRTICASRQLREKRGHRNIRHSRVMFRYCLLLWKSFDDPVHGIVATSEAGSFRPIQHSFYALP